MLKPSQDAFIQEICDKIANNQLNEQQALALLGTPSAPAETKIQPLPPYLESFLYNEPYLRDHVIYGQQVILGVTYCSLAIEAFKKMYPDLPLTGLQRFTFFEPVKVLPSEKVDITVSITQQHQLWIFEINYQIMPTGATGKVATGEYLLNQESVAKLINLPYYTAAAQEILSTDGIYSHDNPVKHFSSLQTVQTAYVNSQANLAKLRVSDELHQSRPHYFLHPALLDGACTTAVASNSLATTAYVPFYIQAIYLSQTPVPYECHCLTELTKITADMLSCDVKFCDPNGAVLATISGLTFKKIDEQNFFKTAAHQEYLKPQPLELNPPTLSMDKLMSHATPQKSVNSTHSIANYIKSKLAQQLAITIEQVNTQVNFIDLGLESMQLMNLAREMEAEIGFELYPTLFFEYATVDALTTYFEHEYTHDFERFFAKTAPQAINPIINMAMNTAMTPAAALAASVTIPAAVVTHTTQAPQPQIQAPIAQHVMTSKTAASDTSTNINLHDIAIIGMSGMLPQSENLEQFLAHLQNGVDLVQEVPSSHWDYQPWFDANGNFDNKIYCKWGSFIEDFDKFDANFFDITEAEAKEMDPQIRLLLQVLYATADDAGFTNRIRGSATGMYVGSTFQDYISLMYDDGKQVASAYKVIGNSNTMIANRASYYFNLSGPSLMLDTTCSSSLVALHLACQALRNNECETAFVAGVNLILSPRHYLNLCSVNAYSPTGRCYTFDESADGYVPAEAIVAVLIKPLAKAIADNDQIHAVIKGSALNHGGYAPAITAPNPAREAEVMLKAWQDANIDPRTLSYIEAHGTGTKLGDPIEIQAIHKAFSHYTTDEKFCAIGSLKSHLGHAEAASGLASLVKLILTMKAQCIVAMPNFKKLNSFINLAKSPLYINHDVQAWPTVDNQPRRAGINSFGFGGTYAHIVIEEFKAQATPNSELAINTRDQFILLSAKDEAALKRYAMALKTYLVKRMPELSNTQAAINLLTNIAYTLQVGREAMSHRLVLSVSSLDDLVTKLDHFLEQSEPGENMWVGQPNANQLNLLIGGHAGKVFIEALLKEQNLATLAQLWLLGAQIDWTLLYDAKVKPQKISLPSYPFAKVRYWFNSQESEQSALPAEHTAEQFSHFMQQQLAQHEISAADYLATVSPIQDTRSSKLKKVSEKAIKNWLYKELGKITQLAKDKIDADLLFENFGLNSIDMIELYRRLGQFLGWQIPPGAFQDARTINSLAQYALSAQKSNYQAQMQHLESLA